MDRTALVTMRIEDGRRLINQLIEDGLMVFVAFWSYLRDVEKWRLYIVTDSLHTRGIKTSYLMVVDAVEKLSGLRIELDEITLLEPERPVAAGIAEYAGLGSPDYDAWFEKVFINGKYIDLAYAYPIPTTTTPTIPGSWRVHSPVGTLRF